MTNVSAKEYIDEIFSKTGVALSPNDPVMVVHAMLEKFFTDVFSEHQELYEDLKEHVSTLKVDADNLDARRRDKWLADANKVQESLLSALRLQTDSFIREQRSSFREISDEFSKKIYSTMRDASTDYASNVKWIFWFTLGNMIVLSLNLILFVRNL